MACNSQCEAAWFGCSPMRFCIGLMLAALSACGAPDRAANLPPTAAPTPTSPAPVGSPATPTQASPTSFPTFTPETPFPTAAVQTPATIVALAETPTGTPTAIPKPTVELPPTPAQPVSQAFDQLAGDVLLYADRHGFLMLTDGAQTLWLTSDGTSCDTDTENWMQRGEWSRDGHFLAFTCGYAGASAVLILDIQTRTLKRLDAGASITSLDLAWPHAWSPTTTDLLVVARSGDGQAIAIVDPVAGRLKQQRLLGMGNLWSAVAWSPDGSRIAILRVISHGTAPTPGVDPGLYVIDINRANLRALADVFVDGAVFRSLDWSQDGRSIVVDHSIEEGLWADLIAPDTGVSQHEQVTDTLRVPTVFHWSPDGRLYLVKEWLPATADGSTSQTPAVIDPNSRISRWSLRHADGTLIRRFASEPGSELTNIAWMPDSQRFMMLAERPDVGIELIAADISGQQTSLATYPYLLHTPNQLTIAPSGDLLAIGLSASHVVLMDTQGQVQTEFDGHLIGWRPRH